LQQLWFYLSTHIYKFNWLANRVTGKLAN
jgi:hypothetical protein